MTQDEIIEIARQAGFPFNKYGLLQGDVEGEIDADAMFVAFAKLVAAKEREACAKVCDENAKKALNAQKVIDSDDLSDVFLRHHASAHFQSAKEIRARGEA